MRVPLSWLREYAPIDESVPAAEVATRLTAAGLEVESVEAVGHDVSGVVVAEVTAIEELTGFRKPIRYCHVTTGTTERDVICGAANFAVGDRVPFAAPGAVLPGGFEIGAKKAYGRMSEGMICSAAELAIGDDHSGILVLVPDAPLGADFAAYAGLADQVFDISVTPNLGYALSVRGVCDRFVLREVHGLDPAAPTPLWMRVRLARAGMRTVSLAVDVTNYLMVEMGQPLHAFDRDRLTGPIVVRRAQPGERLETLDHVVRPLDPDDILITDETGPISMAGTMGGLATEISESSANLVIEAAHFSARGTARMSRRHRLFSEASYRFEREVDRELPVRASAKAAVLLAELGGATVLPGCSHAQAEVPPVTIRLPVDYPGKVAGLPYLPATVIRRLRDVGCVVTEPGEDAGTAPGVGAAGDAKPSHPAGARSASLNRHLRREYGKHESGPEILTVVPPSWRQDLRYRSDLAEEVIRLEGYDNVPVRMPRAAAGKGLTGAQRLRRAVGRALAGTGYVEVLSQPFSSAADYERMQLPGDDVRRWAVRIANPLSEDEPLLRTTLLPGLLRVLARNIGRGFGDLALYEMGLVFRLGTGGQGVAPIPRVDRGPTVAEVTEMESALPAQPLRVGVVLSGNRESSGWWGGGRPAGWQDAIEAAREVLRVSRVGYRIEQDQYPPWHPGRCAAVYVTGPEGDEQLAGHAGELHPRVIQAFRLPDRTCAVELDMSVIGAAAAALPPAQAPTIYAYPVATQDVALVVRDAVPAAQVQAALAAGASSAAGDGGELLEDVRLFDIYTGEQVGEGNKSLAYRLRFRAPDRTLTDEETSAARDAAVAEAARRVGAVLRDGS